MNNDQSTPADDQPPEPTDIFLWANQADAHKDELEIDLFLFTKGYTVYATNYAKELKGQSPETGQSRQKPVPARSVGQRSGPHPLPCAPRAPWFGRWPVQPPLPPHRAQN